MYLATRLKSYPQPQEELLYVECYLEHINALKVYF
jgi:hypothetical protein